MQPSLGVGDIGNRGARTPDGKSQLFAHIAKGTVEKLCDPLSRCDFNRAYRLAVLIKRLSNNDNLCVMALSNLEDRGCVHLPGDVFQDCERIGDGTGRVAQRDPKILATWIYSEDSHIWSVRFIPQTE